jgi:hypothetical protein
MPRTRRIYTEEEIDALPVSRQRKWQILQRQAGRCVVCGKPATSAKWCAEHAAYWREYQRKRIGSVRRYQGAKSYRKKPA